ncbi:tRNA dihydrouridine(20/20a) synthase DusA [Derxia lacustris]|uniref:tRNA dihydrouridine(20/20a) synthase DusA n=1 Tax=Derxia lacustris TaxID=764842 RepID=UPI001F2DF057|nr:tRNA dihydrouridine(20/20a) synthase DusA [Derxia lacustris]
MRTAAHRICVAPMLDWTDRHCRQLHRLLSPRAFLYTEMVTSGALLHGDVPRHLRFDAAEHPVALQLGGSEPAELAQCAKLAADYGYDEINLNCGCPSERVQRGSFGACLMAEPQLVADCVKAMADATPLPVTVKHRIGLDRVESYDFVRDFVGVVAEAGCGLFIVHARNAWLKGLSPKENREVPPLRYDFAERLKRDFPALQIVVNGGIADTGAIGARLAPTADGVQLDGVMIGREAYHNPYALALWEGEFLRAAGDDWQAPTRETVLRAMAAYAAREQAEHGTPLRNIARHLLGLYNGMRRARRFRQLLSDANELRGAGPELLLRALEVAEGRADSGVGRPGWALTDD